MNKEQKQPNIEAQFALQSVSTRFLCDVCGDEKEGSEKHKMYDENWNLQEGLNMCEDCYREGLGVG